MISFLKFHPERLLFPKADVQITKKWAKSRSAFGHKRTLRKSRHDGRTSYRPRLNPDCYGITVALTATIASAKVSATIVAATRVAANVPQPEVQN